jgi:hypothetical protein
MGNRFDDASKRAARQTDAELQGEIGSLSSLSEDSMAKLFPKRDDQEKLRDLLQAVKSATDENAQVAAFREKMETCGHIALRLVKTFVKPL